MPKVDDRLWLSDELWEQIRPPRARGRFTITFAVALLVVAAWLAQWAGIFHPTFVASAKAASAEEGQLHGQFLALTVEIENTSQISAQIEEFRGNQPGAQHLVGARIGSEIDAAPATSGRVTTTAPSQRPFDVVVYYTVDCAKLSGSLRLDIGTRGFVRQPDNHRRARPPPRGVFKPSGCRHLTGYAAPPAMATTSASERTCS